MSGCVHQQGMNGSGGGGSSGSEAIELRRVAKALTTWQKDIATDGVQRGLLRLSVKFLERDNR